MALRYKLRTASFYPFPLSPLFALAENFLMPFPVLLWSLVIFASFWGYGETLRHLRFFSFFF